MVQSLVYQIWDVRNKVRFQNRSLVVSEVVRRATEMCQPTYAVARDQPRELPAVWRGHKLG